MSKNLFEDIQCKRLQIKNFADAALKYEWIDQKTYDDIIKKIESDTITIGVIGQMKCGKSTFINAFLFENEILPAATTPMTAALSVITYGEKKCIEIEFYNNSEWSEMCSMASRDISEAEGDKALESKIKAAKELIDKSSHLGTDLKSLLGKKIIRDFDKLIEYVGADGNYVSITKSVTIYYPKEWLKGVKIVDTPGFNDPVASREERTQQFLKNADVVLMLLYAQRAFDETDKAIIFEKVRSVGVGKILIGVNKYDIGYAQGDTIEEIKENVTTEIRKACKEYRDQTISELFTDLNPIPFSANMALMAKMPINEVIADEDKHFHWKKACDTFEISDQNQMLKKSLISNLENAIKEIIEKSKIETLIKKRLNVILQAGMDIKFQTEKVLNEKKIMFDSLSIPDDELVYRLEGLSKAHKRVEKKISRSICELEEKYKDEIEKIRYKLEDLATSAQKDIYDIIDTQKKNTIKYRVEMRWEKLVDRELKQEANKTQLKLRKILKDQSIELGQEIEEIIRKYIDNPDDLLEGYRDTIDTEIYNIKEEANINNNENSSDSSDFSWSDLFLLPVFPIAGLIIYADGKINYKKNMREKISEQFQQINFNDYYENCMREKTKYSEFMRTTVMNEILTSTISQLEQLRCNKTEKENMRKKIEIEISELDKNFKNIRLQISEMIKLKDEMFLG